MISPVTLQLFIDFIQHIYVIISSEDRPEKEACDLSQNSNIHVLKRIQSSLSRHTPCYTSCRLYIT